MASSKEEDEKARYFNQLAALNDSSDDEEDSSSVRHLLKQITSLPQVGFAGFTERVRSQATFKKVPGITRTTSAPPASNSSVIKETPLLLRKSSLRTVETTPKDAPLNRRAAALISETSVVKETPPQTRIHSLLQASDDGTPSTSISIVEETPETGKERRPQQERRTASDPTLGSATLSLRNSAGINAMLNKNMLNKKRLAGGLSEPAPPKKKGRKATSFPLLPPEQRIFAGKTIYYIPPNDKNPLREQRITKARERGATWTRDFTDEVDIIVAEKDFSYEEVIKHLKIQNIPQMMTLVNDNFLVHCYKERIFVDPTQKQYVVKKEAQPSPERPAMQQRTSGSNTSLKIKATKEDGPRGTPSQSQRSTQGAFVYNESVVDEPTRENPTNTPWYDDELQEMMVFAREMEGVPQDDEEDYQEDLRAQSQSWNDPDETGSEDDRPRSREKPKKRKKKGTGGLNQENFQCMTGGTGETLETNPNRHTIEMLQKMADHYTRNQDQWRSLAYRKAIGQLKKQSVKISYFDQAYELPHIGERIAKKIEEIVVTGRLRRLEYALAEPGDEALQLFMKIYGSGPHVSAEWVRAGYRTLDDLLTKAHLTRGQRMGIEHFDELNTRIPRDEVTELGKYVMEAAAEIDPQVTVTIGGSYRRGAVTSGDIDCLITKEGTSSSKEFLPFVTSLVGLLERIGFLVDALAVSSEKGSGSKWQGCCVLPGQDKPIWRRIDLLLVPETELGAALLYFTGDDIFNRMMRGLAQKRGWRLNQRGLYRDVMRGQDRVKLTEGSLIEGADEKKIFEALGVAYRPPEHRIYH